MDKWLLIYDGDCEFCRRQIDLLERHDARNVIEPVPFQTADLSRYGLTRQATEEAMHLVSSSGSVWRGAAAAREILKLIPRGWILAWIFYLPGAMFVAERVYSWVARRRHRFGCESEVCQRGL